MSRITKAEQLEIDFEAGHKADLILYLSNGLRQAASLWRAEFPFHAERADSWETLADEGREYALANDVHRQTFKEIVASRCKRCENAMCKSHAEDAVEIGRLQFENSNLRCLLKQIVEDCDEGLCALKLPTLLKTDLDRARTVIAKNGEGSAK